MKSQNHATIVRSMLIGVILCSIVCGITMPVHGADLPSPRLDRIFPLGGAAGTQVEIEVQGKDLEELQSLIIAHAGFQIEPVAAQERKFRITIAADVPPGTYDLYASSRFGVSNPRRFAVTHRLQTIADDGKNHEPSQAQEVSINCVIDGMADGNRADFYRIGLQAGQRLLIDCEAQRLDSPLDGVLTLSDSQGRALAIGADEVGQDPRIDFLALADGDYWIAINDLSYRGGHPYRLTITNRPTIENLFPAAIQVGTTSRRELLGRNLQEIGGVASEWQDRQLPLDSLMIDLQVDSQVLNEGAYSFVDHATHHSVAPTAATCTLVGQQLRIPGVDSLWSSPSVVVTPHTVLTEVEPNDALDQTQLITLPAVLGGRMNQQRDVDRFAFRVPERGNYLFNVYCERIAGRADPVLVLMNDKGERVQELDDFGHRINAFDGHLRDPSQEISLEADRDYHVLIQDRYGRGGARYHYVLEIVPSETDFFAAVIHRSNPDPTGINLFRGTATYLDLVLHHRGNQRGEVQIHGENLPPGLHVAATSIPNDTRGVVVLWADEDAPEWTGPINLIATTQIDGQTIRRRVRPYARVRGDLGSSVEQRELMVAIREQGPYDLRLEPLEMSVQAGETATATLHLKRFWSHPDPNQNQVPLDYPVTIQPLSFPNGFQLGNFEIAAGSEQATVEIKVPENARPGRYSVSVLGQAQVPFNKDPQATNWPVTLIATPSRSMTIVVREKETR